MKTKRPRLNLEKFLAKLKLEHGNHAPDHTFCVMEAVAYIAGEEWSDRPQCASSVLTDFCMAWNDGMNDEDRQLLKPFIPRLAGSKNPDLELKRSYMAFDWLCRVSAPTWLRLAKLEKEATAIEACAPIVDKASAEAATAALKRGAEKARAAGAAAWAAAGDAARDAARAAARDAARAAAWDAARDAAWAAAGDAARDAARDAAWDAAWDAARDAARAAAWDAARDAARDAAGAAARDALRPTVVALQKSALELLDEMLKLGEAVAA